MRQHHAIDEVHARLERDVVAGLSELQRAKHDRDSPAVWRYAA